jgi:hypothetical protein
VKVDAYNFFSSYNWLASIEKINFLVTDAGYTYSSWLSFTNFNLTNQITNTSNTDGFISGNSTSLNGTNVVNFTLSFTYTLKYSVMSTVTGSGTINYVSNGFNFTRLDNSDQEGRITVNFAPSTVNLQNFPGDSEASKLQNMMGQYLPSTFFIINIDLQSNLNTFYYGKSLPKTVNLQTQNPAKNYSLDVSFETSPNYTSNGIVYALKGLATSQAKKKFLERNEEKVSVTPTFLPTNGGQQLFISINSLIPFINTVSQGLPFAVTDQNNPSTLFQLNIGSLAHIYPGVTIDYPDDYQININAVLSKVAVVSLSTPGVFQIDFTITDKTGKVILGWNSKFTFLLKIVWTSKDINFIVVNIEHYSSEITSDKYLYIDMITLQQWVKDAFEKYNPQNWQLFKNNFDVTNWVKNITNVHSNSDGIYIYGNR